MLYTTGGTRRSVVALDGKTGELLWAHSLREGKRAGVSPRQLSGRGLSYWSDGRGDDRILYVTTGYRLVALNAKNGAPISGFGKDGIVDLKDGVVFGDRPADRSRDRRDRPACDAGDRQRRGHRRLVVPRRRDGQHAQQHQGPGARFDVRTGKLLWTFNTIPLPGEFGNDTWEKDSWAVNGNNGVWTQITVDEELGLVYLPVETPTSDYYGGHRPGNNLFAESLVCVDLQHRPAQVALPARAPSAVELRHVVGADPRRHHRQRPRDQGGRGAGQAGRALFVFDRVTGQPVWPIEERPVPQSDVPGEKTSPTQPFPTKPPAYARNYLKVPDDLIDFTPEMRAQALKNI